MTWTIDHLAIGEEMHALAEELFPITRSLTGPGFRETLARLEAVAGPMQRHRYPTGSTVLDWKVPPEWTIREAWIEGPDGSRIVDMRDTNLHVLNYAAPIDARLSLEELDDHLYSLPDLPDAIPYRTSYYAENWGFCLPHRVRAALPEGQYHVFIDSTLEPGYVELGEVVLPGASDYEVLISTYCCHPSMANNELSGPLVAAFLARHLRGQEGLRYTYRFLFGPETIGAICYLDEFGDRLAQHLLAGYVATCVGDPGPFTYKRSRNGASVADRIAEHVLRHHSLADHSILDFFPSGSDERQYCSPGFDLPVGSIMRTMYGTYPEYHTSLDDLEFVTPDGLAGGLQIYLRAVQALEVNQTYQGTVLHGEPQLGSRGMYPSVGAAKTRVQRLQDMMWILNLADGTLDLLSIAERASRPIWELHTVVNDLVAGGLLTKVDQAPSTRG